MSGKKKTEPQEKPIGITLRLPPDLWEKIHAYARHRRISLQKLIVELIEKEIKSSSR
ncbi:DUF2274 domain-containing protein [Desulfovibrio aminophilus]|nr:DUF2274 domain-containing protein [Desulfovibrio aminophilus]MCM0754190.1 DUF2274 domain-containing protein [Desulfovibrio aminophilus]